MKYAELLLKNNIIIIFFLSICFSSYSQEVLKDLSDYKKTVLSNGLSIITVKTDDFDYINFKFIIDFHSNSDRENPGAIEILSHLTGFEKTYKTQISKNLVCENDAIDSLMNFMRLNLLYTDLSKENVEKSRDYLISIIKNEKNSRTELWHESRYYSFGDFSDWAVFPDENEMSYIDEFIVSEIHKKIIKANHSYIIAVGNIEHDTIVKYATRHFALWTFDDVTKQIFTLSNFIGETQVFYNDRKTSPQVAISRPVKHFYDEENFMAVEIAAKVFENKITEILPKYNYAENIEFSITPRPLITDFYLAFDTKPNDLSQAVFQSIQSIRDMVIYGTSKAEINNAKSDIVNSFFNTLQNPYNIAQYAYITDRYELSKSYFETYAQNINKIPASEINNISSEVFKPDNLSIYVRGNYQELICQLYSIAKIFKVNFYDKDKNLYKIIRKNFDSDYIINDYLNACNAATKLKNLTIKFDAVYNADTIYNVEGIIYKKYPDLYYYKTQLIIDEDTLLQNLQIANEEVWLDSSALGAEFYTSEVFWTKIYQAYIFPELFYTKLNYEPEIICDTALMKKNIFVLKINTPFNFYYLDYYDLNFKEKIKTETYFKIDGKFTTVQIVEYSNYKKISKKSDIKIPFTIKQIYEDIIFTIQIREIDDKSKINKKIFHFENPDKNIE